MPTKIYALTMARYNSWQNDSLVAAASALSPAARAEARGAFFGSIQKTFSHVLWGDMTWMSRFSDTPKPEVGLEGSATLFHDWSAFCAARRAFDARILEWAHHVTPAWFEGDLRWVSSQGGERARPKSTLVIQLFNHQTHHRGQIHAMLTAAGATPDDTDLQFMPERFLTL